MLNTMKSINIIALLLLGTLWTLIPPPAKANLATDLHDGQHVLLMRHADAPGYGDPAGYQLGNCSTQRNLGDKGRRQAVVIGEWLNKQGIRSAKVISSPWCRCLDTARLLDKGSVIKSDALGSFFDDMSLQKQKTQELEKLIRTQLSENPNTPLILVTHHVNIQAFTGKVVNVGDMVLVRVDKNGKYISQQTFPSPNI